MKSKKMISVLLSAMLLLVSMLSVSAEKPAAEIDVDVNVLTVTVRVQTDAAGQMNLQIVNKANNVLAAMTESTEYVVNEDGKKEYTFQVPMQSTHATGTYTARVGNNVAKTEKDFTFTNAYDLVNYYEDFLGAGAEGIYDVLTGENSEATYDLTVYENLSEDVRQLVDAELADIESYVMYDEEGNEIPFPEEITPDTIATVEAFFRAVMDETVPVAVLSDKKTDTTIWQNAVNAEIEDENLDGKFAKDVSAAGVKNQYNNVIEPTLNMEDVAKAYDEATLLTVVQETGYQKIQEAFTYYSSPEKNVVTFGENYQMALASGLATDLYKSIQANKASATSIENLVNLAESCAIQLLANPPIAGGAGNAGGNYGGSVGGNNGGGGAGGGYKGNVSSGVPNSANNGRPGTGAVVDGDAGEGAAKEDIVYDTQFADLSSAEWAKVAVEGLAAKGYVSGRGDGNFYPNDKMTREEFVKLIVVAFDAYDAKAEASFADVAGDRWSYQYIASANRLGLVTGVSETEFNPAGTVTREDMAVIMHRLFKLMGLNTKNVAESFTDADTIAPYAKEAVGVLAGEKVINGMGDGTFAPKASVTRAQASKVVYELLALTGGVN